MERLTVDNYWIDGFYPTCPNCGEKMRANGDKKGLGIEMSFRCDRQSGCRSKHITISSDSMPKEVREHWGLRKTGQTDLLNPEYWEYLEQMKLTNTNSDDMVSNSEAINPNYAPTLAEFQRLIDSGAFPEPDAVIDGIPLYRGITASTFKGCDRKDYVGEFASPSQRGCFPTRELPSELESLAAYQDVKFYTVVGATDHRLAIGLEVGGKANNPKSLRGVLRQQGVKLEGRENHILTFWLLKDYLGLSRDNKELASRVKGATDRGLERQTKSELAILNEAQPNLSTPDFIQGIVQQEIQQGLSLVVETINQKLSNVSEEITDMVGTELIQTEDSIKAHIDTKVDGIIPALSDFIASKLDEVLDMSVTSARDAEEWLRIVSCVETLVKGQHTLETKLNTLVNTKRTEVADTLKRKHINFIYHYRHGCCPITNTLIVTWDDKTNQPEIIRDPQGRPIGEFDHHQLPNKADEYSTWLISTDENRRLFHNSRRRLDLASRVSVYISDLEAYEIELEKQAELTKSQSHQPRP